MFLLTDYQEKAVNTLVDYTLEAFTEPERQIKILLKAPTGAGKTVSAAAYILRLVEVIKTGRNENMPQNIAFIWLAPNTLHLQSYAALTGFYSELGKLNTIRQDDLTETVLNPNDVLFLNWASVNSQNNVFIRGNELGHSLENLILNTRNQNTEIIVLIDEAHLAAFTGPQALKVLQIINAKIELAITATPTHRPDKSVTISRNKVIEAQMIKKGVRLNTDINEAELQGTNINTYLLRKALQRRQALADCYSSLNIAINPLLLIQLPSDKAGLSEEDRTLKDQLEAELKHNYNIYPDNGTLAIWLSDSKDKLNLAGIERPNAVQTVLIFKQAIAQGWDCTRAAVLLIFREIQAVNFGIQTVGRILRMPQQKHYHLDVLNYGYVYTNLQANILKFVPDEGSYFETQIAYRRTDLNFNAIDAGILLNDRATPGYINRMNFEKILFRVAEEKYGLINIPPLTTLSTPEEINRALAYFELNKNNMRHHLWEMAANEVNVPLPVNLELDPYEVDAYVVDNDHTRQFAIDTFTLTDMLDSFCYNSITRLNKAKSFKNLKIALLHLFEFYFCIPEYDAQKILLYNRQQSTELIDQSLEAYDVWQREQGNNKRRTEDTTWIVPETRTYSNNYSERNGIVFHALKPFYELLAASNPERLFVAELERYGHKINWWYKNGDKGQEHYSITYTKTNGSPALFYPDFIVQFANNCVGIFDTKTLGSDPEAAQKHNALVNWCAAKSDVRTKRYLGSLVLVESRYGITLCKINLNIVPTNHDFNGWSSFSSLFTGNMV